MIYRPTYDTTIRSATRVDRHTTIHLQEIDWDYPFEPSNTWFLYDEGKAQQVEQLKDWLRICERFKDETVFASTDGGWPRFYQRVLGVGMISAWPYWQPRPSVSVAGILGVEYADWMSLTAAEVRNPKEKQI